MATLTYECVYIIKRTTIQEPGVGNIDFCRAPVTGTPITTPGRVSTVEAALLAELKANGVPDANKVILLTWTVKP